MRETGESGQDRTWDSTTTACATDEEPTAEIRDREIDLDGARVHYLTAGDEDGLPLLLLHGAGESATDWQWVSPILARSFRVIAPDFPGFGQSARPRVEYSPAFLEGFVAAFLDALQVPRAVLVGNSMGGLGSLRFALSAPWRVPALVLVDSAGLGREVDPGLRALVLPGLGEWATIATMTIPGQAVRLWWRTQFLFAHPGRAPAEWIAEQDRLSGRPDFLWHSQEVLRALITPCGQREILRDRLADLTMPTLVLWGEHDRIFPVSQALDAVGQLRRGHLAVIPDCGHLPHVEFPELFLEALSAILEEALAGVESDGIPAGSVST